MIEGEFTIYPDEKDNTQNWAIFKRLAGDQFLFKELFDAVISRKEIYEDFILNE
jgi:hypothetical protein